MSNFVVERLQRSFRNLGLALVVAIRKMGPRSFEYRFTLLYFPNSIESLTYPRFHRNHIVPQHWMLAQIAILSKSYNYGVSVFDSDPFHVEPETTAIDARDVRLFFYYAGICYLGMKKWSSAVEWFKTVIAAPAIVPSAIQVESYRKYVLASLLSTGSVESAPRYANPQLLRHLKQLSQPYDELATAYGTNSTDDVHKCAEANHEVFRKDSNFGLVKQVIKSLYRRNIQRLTKTYLTLSLDDIAKQVKLPSTADAERLILQCIENGEIFATISQKDGMVSFQENPEQYNSSRTLHMLDSNLKRTMELLRILQNTEESVSLSHKYLEKVVSADRGSGAGRWPGAGPGDVDDMDVSPLDRPQGAGMRI
jgi:COP9 signalosome complex subunit 3